MAEERTVRIASSGFELGEKSVVIFDEAQRAPDVNALSTEGVEKNDE